MISILHITAHIYNIPTNQKIIGQAPHGDTYLPQRINMNLSHKKVFYKHSCIQPINGRSNPLIVPTPLQQAPGKRIPTHKKEAALSGLQRGPPPYY